MLCCVLAKSSAELACTRSSATKRGLVDLFHETDRFHFKPGYKNRRINITLLFGKRGAGYLEKGKRETNQ